MDDETLKTFLRQQQEIESLAEDIACRVASLQARQEAVLEAVAGAREMGAEVLAGTKRASQRLDLACSAMNTVSVVLGDLSQMSALVKDRLSAISGTANRLLNAIYENWASVFRFFCGFMVSAGGQKAADAAAEFNAKHNGYNG